MGEIVVAARDRLVALLKPLMVGVTALQLVDLVTDYVRERPRQNHSPWDMVRSVPFTDYEVDEGCAMAPAAPAAFDDGG